MKPSWRCSTVYPFRGELVSSALRESIVPDHWVPELGGFMEIGWRSRAPRQSTAQDISGGSGSPRRPRERPWSAGRRGPRTAGQVAIEQMIPGIATVEEVRV